MILTYLDHFWYVLNLLSKCSIYIFANFGSQHAGKRFLENEKAVHMPPQFIHGEDFQEQ